MKRRLFSTSAAVKAAAAAILVVSSPADAWSPFIHSPSSFFLGRHGGRTSSEVIIRMDNSNGDDNISTGGASTAVDASEGDTDTNHQVHETRRAFLNAAAMNICLLGGAATVATTTTTTTVATPAAANAADPAAATGATKYISGKPPQIGGKPAPKSNSGDVKGTRKDPDFLRSIADCRSQCQATAGPDGLSKSKEDCLSECQDICCKTYEQCTFNIVPRI